MLNLETKREKIISVQFQIKWEERSRELSFVESFTRLTLGLKNSNPLTSFNKYSVYALLTLTDFTFWYRFFFIRALMIDPFIAVLSVGFILLTLKRGRGGFTSGWIIAGLRILGKRLALLLTSINFLYSFSLYLNEMSSESLYPSVSSAELYSSF